jgi:hypothetical protein
MEEKGRIDVSYPLWAAASIRTDPFRSILDKLYIEYPIYSFLNFWIPTI